MRAIQIMRFGGPEVLEVREVEQPSPRPGEVLVAVQAASVNGHDTITRSGGLKIVSGRRFPIGVGLDFAGTVAGLGTGADDFTVGDLVWGMIDPRRRHSTGSAAQFVVVPQRRMAPAPAALSATGAASLVVAGATALTALDDVLDLRAGQRLLVRGAAGGVGSAAVQLGRARGAHVTALAGARHGDLLRELGAAEVLDRSSTDLRTIGPFDAVFDTVGTELARVRRTGGRHGRTATIALSGPALAPIALSSIHGTARVRNLQRQPGPVNPRDPYPCRRRRAPPPGRRGRSFLRR